MDLHGGKIREAAAGLGVEAREILDFSANINFLGPGTAVVAAAREAIDEMSWYPEDPPRALRRAAATFLGVPEEAVLLGNGASELIFLVTAYFRPDRAVVLGPTFTEYERAARAWGAEVDVLPLPTQRDFCLSPGEVDVQELDRLLAGAGLLFLCDPNNPTGGLLDRGTRRLLLERSRAAQVPVFVDESFLAFTSAWPEGSVTREGWPHVIVLHSFTKILAMPGLRVGALVVPPRWRQELGLRVPPWNINCVAQAAAAAGFAQAALLEGTPLAVAQARVQLVRALESLPGVDRVYPADANFLCLRLLGPLASVVTELLREEHGILVRDLSRFPGMGGDFLRVAVRSERENERLRASLEVVLDRLCGGLSRGAAAARPGVGSGISTGLAEVVS